MAKLQWNDAWSVGDKHLDGQHKQLVGLINMLEDDNTIPTVIDALGEYVRRHFHDEEAAMERAGYPDLVAHREQHAAFREWLASAEQMQHRGEVAGLLRDGIRAYLRTWLVNHILVSDKAYMPHLKK